MSIAAAAHAESAAARVALEGIRKSFGGVPVLRGIDLAIAPGEVLGLVGENGAGKSTLMNILGGDVPPDAGSMHVGGRPYLPGTPSDARAQGIAFVHQELTLFPNLTIAENLQLARFPRRRWTPWIDRAEAPSAATPLAAARGARARAGHAGRAPIGRRAAARRDRPGARRRGARADPRRADHIARRSRARPPARARSRAARRRACRSSTSRTSSGMCCACAIASRCCATAPSSPAAAWRRSRSTFSCGTWWDARSSSSIPLAARGPSAARCSSSATWPGRVAREPSA